MFGKKKKEVVKSVNVDSLIGENIKLIGKIEGSGNLRIDGTIEGDIDYKGSITIGEPGKVNGNISCDDITLAGTINGNVTAKEKLSILDSGKLLGDIEVTSFIVHENASFDGNCKMISEKSNFKQPQTNKKENKQDNKQQNK